jgi:UDP:flavonoid glycosyltransferase YjiC (YdhE family)
VPPVARRPERVKPREDSARLFVFHAYGSTGDILPLLAIAAALQDEGCRVAFIANESFGERIRAAGVPFEPAGTREEQQAALETVDNSGSSAAGAMLRYESLVERNYPRVTRILERLIAEGNQLVVVTHGQQSPVMPACERHGVPVVLAHHSPAQVPDNREDHVFYQGCFGMRPWKARHVDYLLQRLKRQLGNPARQRYDDWRARNGFPRTPGIARTLTRLLLGREISFHRNVVRELALFPEWFARPVGPELRRVRFCGFVFHADDRHDQERVAEEFIAASGAPIVFTPGTAVQDVGEFCGVVAETCRLLDSPAIVLSPFAKRILESAPAVQQSPRILALEHLDLGFVLPRARLFVHHGGIGSLAQALRAGTPQIIRPRMYDQPNNGFRAVFNGIGGVLYDAGYSAAQIASLCRHLESSQVHRRHLAHYGALTRAENGALNAAREIAAIGTCQETQVRKTSKSSKLAAGTALSRPLPAETLATPVHPSKDSSSHDELTEKDHDAVTARG